MNNGSNDIAYNNTTENNNNHKKKKNQKSLTVLIKNN